MAARNHIELIEKTFSVLEAIADSENGLTLSALAASCGLVKSSTFRILFTLSALGYVEKIDSTGAYRATPRLLGLARSPSRRGSLINIARPRLVEVCKKLHESAWLAEWRNGSVIMIDVAEDSHPLQLYPECGGCVPACMRPRLAKLTGKQRSYRRRSSGRFWVAESWSVIRRRH